jgi:hypothetical protein
VLGELGCDELKSVVLAAELEPACVTARIIRFESNLPELA